MARTSTKGNGTSGRKAMKQKEIMALTVVF